MKTKFNYLRKFMAILAMSLLLLSCREAQEAIAQSDFYFKATADGKEFSVKSELYCQYTNVANMLIITGINPNTEEGFTISTNQGAKTGTYNIYSNDTGDYMVLAQYNDANSTTYSTMKAKSSVGKLIISEFDASKKTIKGTFEFDGTDLYGTKVVKVLNGSFYCKGIN